MPLKAKSPEKIEKRLKLFMYGPAGSGKTTSAIQFPNSVVIDMEKGTEDYSETLAKSGSVVLKTVNPDELKAELKVLLTEKHSYRTLIIDPITSLYNGIQEKWTRVFEKHETKEKNADLLDFGPRYWGRVKAEYKSIQRMLIALDMNVIITAHQKNIYGEGMTKIGVGPDSMKGDEYFFDLVFQLENPSGKKDGQRIARTMKERAEIGKWKFPDTFEWKYENFLKFYGAKMIEKEAEPIAMATSEQVVKVKSLLEVVKVSNEDVIAWFTKADVDSWEEMTSDTIQKCIDHLEKKLKTATAA